MSLHPLDPEIVAETDEWFYTSHPRGQELRGPDGDTPLHPTSEEDAEGRRAWVEEYRRRLAEKQAEEGGDDDSSDDDPEDGSDPLDPCPGCCPTDFEVSPESLVIEAEESETLEACDSQAAGAGAGAYTWTTTSQKIALEGAPMPGPQVVEGSTVTVVAGPDPHLSPERDAVVEVTRTQPGCAPLTRQVSVRVRKCKYYRLARPKIIAIATDTYLTPTTTFADPGLPGSHALGFGQDLSSATGRTQPHGPSVGATTAVLETKMRNLLTVFASNDTDGKARRLFDDFLAPNTAVRFWSDPDLTAAAEAHANIATFVSRALSAPNSPERSTGQTRIHQALETAGWDINAAVAPADLGVPAFNTGNKVLGTGDFGNGLGLMINGLQHAIVVAKEYYYDRCQSEYYIRLEYVFYDVFGLDDDDLREFGADGGLFDSTAAEGITAWWQLQHQQNYVPLITRIAFEREFTVPVP